MLATTYRKTLMWIPSTLLLTAAPLLAGGPVNVAGASRIALDGHDPVAFFTDSRPVPGSPAIRAEHDGAIYFFASEAHRKAFAAAPEKYLPQYGGFCAYGVAIGALLPVDLATWQIRDGKLYLNLNAEVLETFNKDFAGYVRKADAAWPGLASATLRGAGGPVNVAGASRIALEGHDPVAFFTDSRAVPGSPAITAEHGGATYFFASEAHRKAFAAAPEKYLPQYGGFCAYGVAVGALFPVDLATWQIRDGKLYLNLNAEVLETFNKDFAGYVRKADAAWPDLSKQARP